MSTKDRVRLADMKAMRDILHEALTRLAQDNVVVREQLASGRTTVRVGLHCNLCDTDIDDPQLLQHDPNCLIVRAGKMLVP